MRRGSANGGSGPAPITMVRDAEGRSTFIFSSNGYGCLDSLLISIVLTALLVLGFRSWGR